MLETLSREEEQNENERILREYSKKIEMPTAHVNQLEDEL